MKKTVPWILAVVVLAGLAACSKPAEPAPAPGPFKPAPQMPADPAAVPATQAPRPVPPAPETAPAAAHGEPAAEAAPAESKAPESPAGGLATAPSLAGTTWVLDDITVTFKDDKTATIKGGPVAAVMPDGLDASYTLKDGAIEVSALGRTLTGSFDGTKLVVDGKTYARQQ